MARDLDSELARLARTVRRRVALLERRQHGTPLPIPLNFAERVLLIWDQARARVRRWLGAP